MSARAAAAIAAALALAVAGCAGDDELYTAEARAVADEFVLALVSDDNPDGAARHATEPVAGTVLLWRDYLVREGVRTVEGPAGMRADCAKAFPVGAPRERDDCLVYRLVGSRPIPNTRQTLMVTARFRIWLAELDGAWKVTEFDYTPRLEVQ